MFFFPHFLFHFNHMVFIFFPLFLCHLWQSFFYQLFNLIQFKCFIVSGNVSFPTTPYLFQCVDQIPKFLAIYASSLDGWEVAKSCSESRLGLRLNGWVRVRTQTLPLWIQIQTRTQALWMWTLVSGTRTRTPPRWTRTHSESSEK